MNNKNINTILPDNDMNGILLRDCRWKVKTAGPSPFNNERTELFFLGCKKAMSGNPCKGCFNSSTWDSSKAQFSHDPIKMAEHINNNSPNKYITIGGGEPSDQLDNLTILCKELKKYNFHIMIYTWRKLEETQIFNELLPYIDIIVDGEFKLEERLWDGTKEDGLLSSIGSGNQIVWDIKNKKGYSMRDLKSIYLDKNNDLTFVLKDNNTKAHYLNN